jgi:predicted esterase
MKPRMLFVLALALSPLAAISAHTVSQLSAAITAFKPGRYPVSVKLDNALFAKAAVEGTLIIPPGVSAAAPVVVFFHGNSRDKKLHKKGADFLVKGAAAKGVILLSMQNWWSLSGDHVEGFDDSRRATNLLLQQLVASGVAQGDKVFLSGFSAGGFTAIASFIQSIHYNEMMGDKEANYFDYAGVISMKGNFYPQFFMPDPMLDPDQRRARYAELTRNKKVILTVGGKKDAPRVQKQAPECRDFLRDWGVQLDYREFLNEGHNPAQTNIDLLWGMVN